MTKPKKGMTPAEAIKVQEGIASFMEQRREARRKRNAEYWEKVFEVEEAVRKNLITEPESKKLISWGEALEQEKVTYERLKAEIEEGLADSGEDWRGLYKKRGEVVTMQEAFDRGWVDKETLEESEAECRVLESMLKQRLGTVWQPESMWAADREIQALPTRWALTIGIGSIDWVTLCWYRWYFDKEHGLMMSKTIDWNLRKFWKVSFEP